MADEKLTDLGAIPAIADGDLLYIVDVSDTTDDASGSSKQVAKSDLEASFSRYLVSYYVTDETTLISTNQPAAERFFLNTHRYVKLLDLSNYTQCRLIVNKQGTAANAGAAMTMKYRAAGFNTTVGNYSDIGTSAVTVATDTTNALLNSGWVNLAAGAIADDVAVCVTETGGDAVLDPTFGYVELQFR